MLEKEPFTVYRDQEERARDKGKTEGIWFNQEEREDLEAIARFFHQEKISTTIKHCIALAKAKIEGGSEIAVIRGIVFNNVRKNRRLGIEEVEPKFRIS